MIHLLPGTKRCQEPIHKLVPDTFDTLISPTFTLIRKHPVNPVCSQSQLSIARRWVFMCSGTNPYIPHRSPTSYVTNWGVVIGRALIMLPVVLFLSTACFSLDNNGFPGYAYKYKVGVPGFFVYEYTGGAVRIRILWLQLAYAVGLSSTIAMILAWSSGSHASVRICLLYTSPSPRD